MTTTEIDLQEQTRRDYTFTEINRIIDALQNIDVFPSLVWVYAWDIVKDTFENNQFADLATTDYVDEAIPEGITLKQIWDKFWEDADKNGWSLEYGADVMHEGILDWMRENDFLVALDEDGWLE